ncbi:MAG: leucine-rich repeat domain-containing protein [Saprospiraceae bacterium]|nr:leucine-rich repeat domain-containing protein [Saprospiraceae bacterium]
MQYQSMPQSAGLTEIGDLRQAKNCTASNVRFVLQQRKLTGLPKGIEHIAHIPRVELDFSYNRTMDHEALFQGLAAFKNIRGLGLIKNEMGTLPLSIGLLENLEVLELWSNELKSLPVTFQHLTQLEYLNLRNNSLTDIPDYFAEFKNLKSLNLQFNKIKQLPRFLFDLGKLEYLNIATCGLTEIPAAIGKLTNLKTLVISKNKLEKLPDEIKNLKKLEILTFEGCDQLDLEQLFELMAELPAMQSLDLSKHELKSLPKSIGKMQQVRKINLRENKLETLPDSFADLQLEELDLDNNLWKMEKLFPVLAKVSVYKSMYSHHFKDLQQSGSFHLPDSIGGFQYLEEIHLSGKSLKSIPAAIGQLENLKLLSITNTSMERLPEAIVGLRGLEHLSIYDSPLLASIPDCLYDLPNLKHLSYFRNGCPLDLAKLKRLPALEQMTVAEPTDEVFRQLKLLDNLKEISFLHGKVLERLPDSFFELESLEKLRIPFQRFDGRHFLQNLPRLKNLRELFYQPGPDIDFEEIVNCVVQLPKLKILNTATQKTILPSILKLAHLEKLHLYITGPLAFHQYMPKEFAFFPSGVLHSDRFAKSLQRFDELKSMVTEKIGQEHPNFLPLLSLLQRDFAAAQNMIENPFDGQGKLNGACIFIMAKPSAGTLKALGENLTARGATVSKALDKKVTHLFLTPNISDEDLPLLVGDYRYILEDHLKEREIAEDTPFLMEAANTELVEQVTNLLKSEQEDQTSLVLELIEGGGATQKIVSYLGAIHLFHKDAEVRKKARTLFRKYASSALQEHVKNKWKDSLRDKDLYHFKPLLKHAELDGGAFLHAWKMLHWHRMPVMEKANDYNLQRFWSINLNELPTSVVTPAFLDFEKIKSLHGQPVGELDWELLEEIVIRKNVSDFGVQASMPRLPIKILTSPSLRKFGAGNYQKVSDFDFSQLPAPNPSVTELRLSYCRITNARQFDKFPNLEKLQLLNCTIDEVEGIANLTRLKNLNIGKTEVPVFGSAFERLTELEDLSLTESSLQELDLNFSRFKNLKRVHLGGNLLTSLPDTFMGCHNLDTIIVNGNQLESLPMTLFRLHSNASYPKLKILAQKNRIRQLGQVQQEKQGGGFFQKIFGGPNKHIEEVWGKISELDLQENQLTEIPDVIFHLQQINVVKLAGNLIATIPADKPWDGRIQRIEISSGEAFTEVPAGIFGKKTHFQVLIYREDTRLPDPAALPPFENVQLGASYQASAELNRRVAGIMAKNINKSY